MSRRSNTVGTFGATVEGNKILESKSNETE